METPYRFEQAIKKLYLAFHNNQLHPEYCNSCAVGNILDRKDYWKHITDAHGSIQLNYVGLVNQKFGKKFNGYSPQELLHIEATFLRGCGYSIPLHHNKKKPKSPTDSETLFKGLSKTIAYLCRLDHVANVMDYSKLFESKNNTSKKITYPTI